MITPKRAVELAQNNLDENRLGTSCVDLLEDATDYMAVLEYSGPTRMGEARLFIRKSDGKTWEMSPGEAFDKVRLMTAVSPS